MSGIVEDLTRVSHFLQLTDALALFHLERMNSATLAGLQQAIEILTATAEAESPLSDQQVELLKDHLGGFSEYWRSCEDLGVINGLAFDSAKLTGSPWKKRMEELEYPFPTDKLLNVNDLIKSTLASSKPDKDGPKQKDANS